jgi:hypothetical protein
MTVNKIRNVPFSVDPGQMAALNSVIVHWENRILEDDIEEFENLIMDVYHAGATAMKETIVQKALVSGN